MTPVTGVYVRPKGQVGLLMIFFQRFIGTKITKKFESLRV